MDSRIILFGGEGVEWFLGNLFCVFDGLFESLFFFLKVVGKVVMIM